MLSLKFARKVINPLFYFLNDTYCEMSSILPGLFRRTPLVLRVRVTSRCNLSCSYCYLKDGLNKEEDNLLTLDEWKKILTPLPKRTVIDITGAEPLAAPDFLDFSQLLSDLGLRYSVTTNGTVYNNQTAEALVKNNLSVLMISLDGLSKTHNELRGSGTAFARTVIFIKAIQDAKKKLKRKTPLINIKTTLLDENYKELEDLMEFCEKEFAVDIFTFTLLFQNTARGGMGLYSTLQSQKLNDGNYAKYKSPSQVSEVIKKILRSKRRWAFQTVVKPRISGNQIGDYISAPDKMNVNYCPQYKNNLTIYYDGRLAPCDIALELGNIREYDYSFKKVYEGEVFTSFIHSMRGRHPACQGCCAGKHSS